MDSFGGSVVRDFRFSVWGSVLKLFVCVVFWIRRCFLDRVGWFGLGFLGVVEYRF